MTLLNRCRSKRTKTLKSSSSLNEVIFPHFGIEGSNQQLEVLSHLLTTTFIARQLGLKVSLKVSGKVW